MKKIALFAAVAASVMPFAAHAQSAGIPGVVASCTMPNAGTGAVDAFLNEAKLSGTLNDQLITQAVVALGQQVGASTSVPVKSSVSACVDALALAAVDPALRARLQQVALAVMNPGFQTASTGGTNSPQGGRLGSND
ncbi:hypothetical protein [Rhizobium glycinendophyticum]|uniref:Uncharacterized protein n=1 Tax=Rhizobium glycinendophyticum TaxID=2589807 RepID=A0A504TQ46_9HYPH|nr:hypothetical protein [Rhizobium glycinendophyticum]TPP03697.1 hypothetical protein FJQ55_23215 [Rhizobium glycinendophyticum]